MKKDLDSAYELEFALHSAIRDSRAARHSSSISSATRATFGASRNGRRPGWSPRRGGASSRGTTPRTLRVVVHQRSGDVTLTGRH